MDVAKCPLDTIGSAISGGVTILTDAQICNHGNIGFEPYFIAC
jgi:hypothetical protein